MPYKHRDFYTSKSKYKIFNIHGKRYLTKYLIIKIAGKSWASGKYIEIYDDIRKEEYKEYYENNIIIGNIDLSY